MSGPRRTPSGGRGQRTRRRASRGPSVVGRRHEVEVGPIAHGGHCVARVPVDDGTDGRGRVVFVRHALPGERVVVELTEGTEGDRFWRGDAVEVLVASPDRVTPPCEYAGPGLCGGCDLQHVDLGAQRRLKAAVVAEQLRRLAGLDVDVVVEEVPGEPDAPPGLRWRTRQRYVPLPDGRRGLRVHRSHEVVEVDDCLIARPDAREPGTGGDGSAVLETVRGRELGVAADGFWQVHPGAPEALLATVLDVLRPQQGDTVLDLYAGVGLFAAFLAEAVGPVGWVTAVEGDATAAALAAENLPGVGVLTGDVAAVLAGPDAPSRVDLVVLDPPRTGAKREVCEAIAARSPRAVAYVACDPAALARDVATFAGLGYTLTSLRAFDLFPMTHHVECVALLEPAAPN
ncbi:TRAM domain-containing protein [uncultured Nocardioides sp.]|uniref:class I SAM-dependent RNA methyltransferase n=1 Tax=uncultured Nocardioides sp. TaxID=198441 RepID=UPI002619C966|nr:TRAM domain-containing protein [uncultured Nocardioides sp.]